MGKKQQKSTQWMMEALSEAGESSCDHFPPEFLCGLRGAMDAGLSCEELTALVVLFTGIYEAGERMSGSELIKRAKHLSCVMKGDIHRCLEEEERSQRYKKERVLVRKRGA